MQRHLRPPSAPSPKSYAPLILAPFFLLASLLFLGSGLFFLDDTMQFLKRASSRAMATVVQCPISEPGGESTRSCMPTYLFFTSDGQTIIVTDSVAGEYQVGQQVMIAYNPDHPQEARITSFMLLWFLPTVLLSLGALFFVIGGATVLSIFFH